jgi:hypothetical protein
MRLFISMLLAGALAGCASQSAPRLPLDGAPPDSVVAASLERAITLSSILHLYPESIAQWPANLELMEQLQPTLVGRAAVIWGWEHLMLRSLNGARQRVTALHARVPDAVVQGCIFEFVSRDVEQVRVPARVLEAFGLPARSRPYRFEDMLTRDQPQWFPGWGQDAAVPDITRQETQLWFFHLATLYLDAGLEAIHLGNLERMANSDPDLAVTEDVLRRIREYAAEHGRRGWVMLDAHTHGVVRSGRLLLDFHSFPLRPQEVGDPALQDVVLERGFQNGIYGRSRGGITPAGTPVEHQRFLVELDNGYAGPTAGGCDLPECVWGSDEITWFAAQSTERRNELLTYFWHRVRDLDPQGRFQMPGVRGLQSLLFDDCPDYLAHDPDRLPCGRGQAATIGALWGARP